MRILSYSQIFQMSFEKTRVLLFKPWSLKKAIALLFIAVMAGAISGGSNIFDVLKLFGKQSPQSSSAKVMSEESAVPTDNDVAASSKQKDISAGLQEIKDAWNKAVNDVKQPGMLQTLAIIFGAITIFLIILLFWINARFNFVWLHSLMTGEVSIRRPFREYKREGNSFFGFMLLFNVIAIAVIGLFMVCILSLSMPRDTPMRIFLKMMMAPAPAALAVLFIIAAAFFIFYVNHIVIPVMAVQRVKFIAAWRTVAGIFNSRRGDVLILPFVFLGVVVITSIIGFLLTMLVWLTGLLPAAIVGGILYFVFYQLLSIQYVGAAALITLGVVWMLIVFVASLLAVLPLFAFKRYFTLHFLSSLNCGVDPMRISAAPSERPAANDV